MSTRDRVILFLLFVGFATLVLEVRYEHRFVIKEIWQGWVPIVYACLAALGCLIGMGSKKAPRTIAATIFFIGFGVSGVGLYFHTKFDPLKFQKFLTPDAKIMRGTGDEQREVNLNQPLAAPLSMAGLSAIGFVLTSGLFKAGRGGQKAA